MLRPPLPPFALASPAFRFPALAALVGRLPPGGGREIALAVLLAVRLADGATGAHRFSPASRDARALSAARWLAVACPDARVRASCERVVAASAMVAPGAEMVAAITAVATAAGAYLDRDTRAELVGLAAEFEPVA